MYDLLIKNGMVIDGTGAPRFQADVAVKDGVIAKIAAEITDPAEKVIDAKGLFVSPGFIDTHTHTDKVIFKEVSAMHKLRCESVDRLFQTFLNLKTLEDCYEYFEDICTIKEILDMSQRLDTAILLSKGLSYQKIAEQVAVSSATIGRVSKCLNYGSGGYQKAITRLSESEEA